MVGVGVSDSSEALEDAHHARSILCHECTRLLLDLLVMDPPRKHGTNNHSDDREQEIIIFSKGIPVVNVCWCQ